MSKTNLTFQGSALDLAEGALQRLVVDPKLAERRIVAALFGLDVEVRLFSA
jgi:hypothetical protein